MKELRWKIMDYLMIIPEMTREIMIGILNPLKTEEQAMEMLEYLQREKPTTYYHLREKAKEIANKN